MTATTAPKVICPICRFPVPEDPAHPGCTAGHTCAGTAPAPVWPDEVLTAVQIDRVLLTLAERAKECETNPTDPEEWASTRHQVAAAQAYRGAIAIIRAATVRAA